MHGFGAYADALEHLAVLRLARIAMVVQEDAEGVGEPRQNLDEYAEASGEAVLQDPFTGKPFLYERHDDRVVLSRSVGVPGEGEWESSRSALFEGCLFEKLLVWEVRRAAVKQGD